MGLRSAALIVVVRVTALWLMGLELALSAFASEGPPPGARALHLLFSFNVVIAAILASIGALLSPLRGHPWRHGMALAGVSVVPVWFVGDAAASGAWISQQSWAPLVRWIPVLAGAAGMMAFGWLLASRRRGLTLTLACVAASTACAYADSAILVGQHRPFHLLLHGLAAMFALAAGQRTLMPALAEQQGGRAFAMVVGALGIVVSALSAPLALDHLSRADLVQRSPTGRRLLRSFVPVRKRAHLHSVLEKLDPNAAAPKPDAAPRGLLPTSAPDGSPWNVLWLTVDALRADTLPPVRTKKTRHARPGDTPFLDEWVGGAWRFSRAYSQSTITHQSMPAMFRSTQTFDGDRIGRPVATAMADLGLTPVAIVNNFFMEPRFKPIQRLLDGYSRVAVYEKRTMNDAVPLALETIAQVRDQRFFAWMHFYNMHSPGFDDRPLSGKDGKWPKRYRRSLKWMDREMKKLLDGLKELGLRDRTLVVLTSDHGEGLGANGYRFHGRTVWHEETHVPLAIEVPGQRGQRIDAMVGNLDVLPTLFDLLGAEPDGLHAGQSLVPLMVGQAPGWSHAYYLDCMNTTMLALMSGRDKLMHDVKAGAYMRYDLGRDPKEDENLFDPGGALDRDLLARLVRLNPKLFKAELGEAETRALLVRRVSQVDATTPLDTLDFLLRLIVLDKGADVIHEGRRLFRQAGDDRARLKILRHLESKDRAALQALLLERLAAVSGTPAEIELVHGLARHGHGKLPAERVAARIRWWLERGDPAATMAWLSLSRRWQRKPAGTYARVLGAVLERWSGLDASHPELLDAALGNIASLRRTRASTDSGLAARVMPFLESPAAATRALASSALGQVGGEAAVPKLEERLREGSPRERQAALHALGRIRKHKAVAAIEAHAGDPLLTVDIIDVLGEIGSAKGVPILEDIAKSNYNRIVRGRAARVLKRLKRRIEAGGRRSPRKDRTGK